MYVFAVTQRYFVRQWYLLLGTECTLWKLHQTCSRRGLACLSPPYISGFVVLFLQIVEIWQLVITVIWCWLQRLTVFGAVYSTGQQLKNSSGCRSQVAHVSRWRKSCLFHFMSIQMWVSYILYKFFLFLLNQYYWMDPVFCTDWMVLQTSNHASGWCQWTTVVQ